jgi:hypothetical protein
MQQIENFTMTLRLVIFHCRIDQSISDATQGLMIPAVDKVLQLHICFFLIKND